MFKKEVVLSGIRATGQLHLGNYLGAMKNFVDLQNKGKYKCFYFVADYHTLTTNPNPKELKSNLPKIVLGYLSAGIDPKKSVLYAQSSVPEIAELNLLIGMVAPISDLFNCPTFKEKKERKSEGANYGLLGYPVLMAADILGPKANLVPVGEDQLVHLEITRDIARRFNNLYGNVLIKPEAMKEKAIRVPGLDGTEKMGKSESNSIDLDDLPEVVWKKLKVAVTDPRRKRRSDSGRPWECNIFTLHELASLENEIEHVNKECRNAGIGCIDCKEILARNINRLLAPLQERKAKLIKQPDYIRQVLHQGGQQARQVIQETVAQVRQSMGLVMY